MERKRKEIVIWLALLLLGISLLPVGFSLEGGVIQSVYADGDGGDGGDGDDGDDGGDDDGGSDDGGDDSGGDDGDTGDSGDEGGDLNDDEMVEWLSEGHAGAEIEVYRTDEMTQWLSRSEERTLIASQWGGAPLFSEPSTLIAAAPRPTPDHQSKSEEDEEQFFSVDDLQLSYPRVVEDSDDDVAVIIGNANYKKFGASIPNVTPAYADADAFSRFAREGLGIREGNIIHLRDATQAQMIRLFGTAKYPQGQLHDWVKRNRSRVYLYFSGHGAPGQEEGNYLVPSDADSGRLALNGFPVEHLYQNLAELDARSVTVVLEACFSGMAQESNLVTHASPIFVQRKSTAIPKGITVIAAGGPSQIASWEQDRSHGLFTKYYLHAVSGEADEHPYGNKDGEVQLNEIHSYLQDTLTYWARRYYGREQVAQIHPGEER